MEIPLIEFENINFKTRQVLLFIYTAQNLLNNFDLQFKVLMDQKISLPNSLEYKVIGKKNFSKKSERGK